MRLSELAAVVDGVVHGGDPEVRDVEMDSRAVEPGTLFVAVAGAKHDGARFIPAALGRGAAAVCHTEPVRGVPTLVVDEPRAIVGPLAARCHGDPATRLAMVGVTGSLGKTSTTLLTHHILETAGITTGVIGSLGIRFRGQVAPTGMTTPEAPAIHRALRDMVRSGVQAAVMEVTSHSLLLGRVAGLRFDAGALTNLVPDEHLEFHPTPEHYLRTKARFFGMLEPGAPLVVNADDPVSMEWTGALDRPRPAVSLAGAPEAAVHVERIRPGPRGSDFVLHVRRPLPRRDGGEVAPLSLELHLSVLGVQQVANAAIAAMLALLIGAPAEAVREGLGSARPMRRRMEVLRDGAPFVLDDTVGNAESIEAVFEASDGIPHERLRVAYAVRGARGETINRHNAEALAAMLDGREAQLVVTDSVDAADERNRVSDAERDVVLGTLRSAGVSFVHEPRLEDAVARVLEGAGEGDLVLLLGAQGMDRGAELARALLARAAAGGPSGSAAS